MPTVPLPLFTRSYKNADETILTDDAAVQYNGFIDRLEGLNIRPGEVQAINSGARSDGMFMWPDKNFIVCVEAGTISLRTVSGETLVDAYTTSSASLATGEIVSFASNGTYVFMAAGGKINYITNLGVNAEIADVNAPITVTQVAYLDGYILAIDGTTAKFYWSDLNNPTSWSALSFATAEGAPDILNSMHVVQRQLYLLGTTTTEIWENDGITPFSRISGGLIEIGCGAKNSVVRHDNSLIWLSHTRQFVKFTGTEVKFISERYDKELMNFSTVSDCIGGFIHHDGQEYAVFTFPTENRTLVYNPSIDDWSEWGTWDSTYSTWSEYDFRAIVRDLTTGKIFIGKNVPVVACLSSDSRQDLTGAGTTTPFKFLRRTGWISNGSNKAKRAEELSFRAKRGRAGVSDSEPVLMLRYRNDGSSNWSNIREISLGSIGETEHMISLKRLGVYKSRQWEISATDNVPLSFAQAEIDITVLR